MAVSAIAPCGKFSPLVKFYLKFGVLGTVRNNYIEEISGVGISHIQLNPVYTPLFLGILI
jgi:hypothetical protein